MCSTKYVYSVGIPCMQYLMCVWCWHTGFAGLINNLHDGWYVTSRDIYFPAIATLMAQVPQTYVTSRDIYFPAIATLMAQVPQTQ